MCGCCRVGLEAGLCLHSDVPTTATAAAITAVAPGQRRVIVPQRACRVLSGCVMVRHLTLRGLVGVRVLSVSCVARFRCRHKEHRADDSRQGMAPRQHPSEMSPGLTGVPAAARGFTAPDWYVVAARWRSLAELLVSVPRLACCNVPVGSQSPRHPRHGKALSRGPLTRSRKRQGTIFCRL